MGKSNTVSSVMVKERAAFVAVGCCDVAFDQSFDHELKAQCKVARENGGTFSRCEHQLSYLAPNAHARSESKGESQLHPCTVTLGDPLQVAQKTAACVAL